MVRTQVSNFCIDYSHWYVARSNGLHVSYGKVMKASKRVRLGLAMLRFAASLDLTFFVFRCYHYSQATANRDKYNQAFLATPRFAVLLDLMF